MIYFPGQRGGATRSVGSNSTNLGLRDEIDEFSLLVHYRNTMKFVKKHLCQVNNHPKTDKKKKKKEHEEGVLREWRAEGSCRPEWHGMGLFSRDPSCVRDRKERVWNGIKGEVLATSLTQIWEKMLFIVHNMSRFGIGLFGSCKYSSNSFAGMRGETPKKQSPASTYLRECLSFALSGGYYKRRDCNVCHVDHTSERAFFFIIDLNGIDFHSMMRVLFFFFFFHKEKLINCIRNRMHRYWSA
jgi:hypothetical protein